jgi:hypothetical protein
VTRDRDEAQHALVKVKFVLDPEEWHGSATETLWAAPVGQNQYRLENSPFYAFGVSYQDVVAAQRTDNELEFVSVVSRGGHSTYRILVQSKSRAEFEKLWKPIQETGCTYEGGSPPLLSIDVPSNADIHLVYRLLEAGEAAGAWSFEEGHCGHSVG